MYEIKGKKITNNQKGQIHKSRLQKLANKNNNKNYGHIVRNKQSVSEFTVMKTVRIIQNNMFY